MPKVSFDKIRLKFLVPESFFGYLLNECEKRDYVDRTKDVIIRNDFGKYAYSVTVHDESPSALWVGFDHRKENESDLKKSLVMDFNPNKHLNTSGFFQVFKQAMNSHLWHGPYVKSVDLAFDFENHVMTDVNVTVLDSRKKSTVQDTCYFGERAKQVKKYNKTVERKKEGVIIPDTVRVEITRPFTGHLSLFERNPVDVSKVKITLAENSDIHIKALSYCLSVGYINESEISRHYMRKIKAFNSAQAIDLQKILKINWDWECLRIRTFFDIDDYWIMDHKEGKNREGYTFPIRGNDPVGSVGGLFDCQA